jgi:hypothetical protein
MTDQPRTLGYYRDFCARLGGEHCDAVKYLDFKIARQGRDEPVLADESQMLVVLGSMLGLS